MYKKIETLDQLAEEMEKDQEIYFIVDNGEWFSYPTRILNCCSYGYIISMFRQGLYIKEE